MTRSERFSNGMHSLDLKLSGMRDISKATYLSDNGVGIERMMDVIDHTEPPEIPATFYTQKLHAAEVRLYRTNRDYLIPTLRLIAENRNNLQESIGQIMMSHRITWNGAKWLYFSHRKKLLKFFSPNKIKGSVRVEGSKTPFSDKLCVHGYIGGRDVGDGQHNDPLFSTQRQKQNQTDKKRKGTKPWQANRRPIANGSRASTGTKKRR